MSMLLGTWRSLWETGGYTYPFSLADITFTPNMAVRAGQAAFDASPIFQGAWDGTGTPEVVTFPRGDLLGNQTQFFYSNFDPYQGSISFWITPEWAGNDGIEHNIAYASANYRVYKSTGNALVAVIGGQTFTGPSTAAWTAGTTYYAVFSYDTKNTIDALNYARWSLNDAQTFSVTTQPTASAAAATVGVGSTTTPTLAADAQIDGLFIWRRPLYDGTYGVPMTFDESGAVDEIAAIYAAGAGADPAQVVSGSWDVTFCLPTDQTEGVLQTTRQAWAHPHGSELIDVPFVDDGGLPGTDQSVVFDGSTDINCGSGATLDDIPSGGEITLSVYARFDVDADEWILDKADATLVSTGWSLWLRGTVTNSPNFRVNLATDDVSAGHTTNIIDGKWHHIAAYYNDTTKVAQVAVDGVWGATDTGVGAYQADAANTLYVGRRQAVSGYLNGGIAWFEVWDNDHLTAGTDFIPPRAPTAAGPGNLIETWWADEGTGATVAARVTSPANDGTITSGSWSAIWAIVGTPEIPQSLQFYQENDGIDFGSGANIDDLPSADCTIEFWALMPENVSLSSVLCSKANAGGTSGWQVFLTANRPRVIFRFDNTDINMDIALNNAVFDGEWHHFAVDWEFATLTARTFTDGVYVATGTAVGNYVVDAAVNCFVNGRGVIGQSDTNFSIGPIRLSDSRRYAVNSFIPPSRVNWPANDANAQLITRMNDGAGVTVTDYSGNGYNGTVTFGASTRWNNTPDLLIDEPGAMIYQQGYNYGSDGADDGIYIPVTLVAATDYVIRIPLQYSPNAWPRITLWDVVGAAAIVDFDAPPLTGLHSGANNSATLTVAGEVFPASLIGSALYNVTDGSSTTITAVGGTNQDTITGVLAGGTDDDWDTNDVYYIVPYSGWVFNEPIVARTSANTAYELRITNRNSDGVITVHQVEHLLSLFDGGDMEAGAGAPPNPWIPTGWGNNGLDAGVPPDSEVEVTIIHSGSQSALFNLTAADEGFSQAIVNAVGDYVAMGWWSKVAAGNRSTYMASAGAANASLHNSATVGNLIAAPTGPWTVAAGIYRMALANRLFYFQARTAAAGLRYVDGIYALLCDPIALTVTPASQANSLEGNGIRVDGRDSATVPATAHRMRARSGGIKWRCTPRHSLALAQGFGQASEYLLDLTEDANNYLRLVRTTNLLTLAVNQNGAGEVTDTDATAWAVDTEVLLEVLNTGSRIRVKRDGVVVCELAGLAGFATDFTAVAYFGSEDTPSLEFDGVIAGP